MEWEDYIGKEVVIVSNDYFEEQLKFTVKVLQVMTTLDGEYVELLWPIGGKNWSKKSKYRIIKV